MHKLMKRIFDEREKADELTMRVLEEEEDGTEVRDLSVAAFGPH